MDSRTPIDGERFVLVGQNSERIKVLGPFDTADDARERCNELGMLEVTWSVVPLQNP